jgi:outer membrane protein OmpA-like peptidoglycan-associated protein
MRHAIAVVVVVLSLALAGCESGRVKSREKGALGGAALGAGLGAIVGNQTGNSGAGIAIGSAMGAIAGAIVGNEMDTQDAAREETDRKLDDQDRVIAENRRLIQDLRARGADVRETRRGVVINLPDVLFEFDRSTLTSGARDTTREIAAAIRGIRDRTIAVEGHTDSVGSYEYNQRLSEDRASTVADALVREGVSRRQITSRGFGERDPIASNDTSSGRSRNRRVEVIVENR